MNAFTRCITDINVYIKDIQSWCEIDFANNYAHPLIYGGRLYLNGKLVTEINLPEGTEKIGSYSLYYCSSLTKITIPDSVTSIGDYAFSGCANLTSITIPDSISNVGRNALLLSNLSYNIYKGGKYLGNANNPYMVLVDIEDTSITSFQIHPNTKIISTAFRNCETLTSITIPNKVISIGAYAFYDRSGLTDITISDSVTNIGDYAFYNCSGLTNITISDSVTSIGDYAFSNCSGLTNITIPDSVTSIADYAFSNCSGLTDITISDSVTSIGKYAFSKCSSLTDITIPDSVTSIGYSAFVSCNNLENITIPFVGGSKKTASDTFQYSFGYIFGSSDGTSSTPYSTYYIPTTLKTVTVTGGEILYGAFYDCKTLTSITLLSDVTAIGRMAFYKCTGLTNITIPDSVTSIGEYAFYNCSGLTNITIPDRVTSIGEYAFDYCSGLTSVVLPDSVEEIEERSFGNSLNLTDVKLGNGLKSIHSWAFYGSKNLERIEISSENPNYASKDGILYNKDFSKIIIEPEAHRLYLTVRYLDAKGQEISPSKIMKYTSGTAYDIPSPEIPGYYTDIANVSGKITQDVAVDVVYYEMDIIANGTWGDIRWVVYEDGTLVLKGKGVMPEGTAPWSDYAQQILELYIDSRITSVSAGAFENCVNLTQVEFGYGISQIGANAFAGCTSLEKLYLPDTVTSIGDGAFGGCTGLKMVVLPDSVQSVGVNAFADCAGLEKVTLGASVENVGDNAFGGCVSLTQVYFRGQPAVLGTGSFGTAQGKFIYYYTSVAGWEDAVVDGLWNGYTAVPYQAIAREDFTGTNIYILKIVDRHNTPLEGAVVQLGDQTQSTNADGMAYFVRPTSAVMLKVSCSGHITLTDEAYTVPSGRILDYVELQDRPTTVQGISCNGQSIATSVYTFNCNAQDMVTLKVQGYSKYEIESYELLQGNRIIATLNTSANQAVFQVSANSFEEGQTVIVRIRTADGSAISSALNLRPLWIAPLSDQQILDELSKVNLWLDAGSFGKISVPLYFNGGEERIYASVSGSTIRVGLNIDVAELFDKGEGGAMTRVEKEIRKKMKTMAKPNSGFNCEVAGYIELEYLGNNEYYVKTSYVRVAVGAELSFKAQASYLGIVGVYFKASFGATGSLELTISRYTPEAGFVLDDATVGLETGLGLEGGAYLLWGAGSAGLYGNLNMGFTVGIVPSWELESVYISGDLGVKWSVLWGLFAGRHTIVAGDLYRWPEVRAYARALMRNAPAGSMSFNDRSYLDQRGQWQSGDSLLTGLPDDAAPQMVTCGDTTVMVWLDDDGSRDDSNYQTLVYSVYNPATDSWSAPAQVDSNDTFDCEFSLYTDGQGIYILYTEQKNVLTSLEQMDYQDAQAVATLISGVEVAFTQFQNGAFSQPVRLTDNDICETLPMLTGNNGQLLALWTAVASMDDSAQPESSQIYGARLVDGAWEKTSFTGSQNGISGLSAVTFDDGEYFAFLLDGDNDPQTGDDMILILSDGSAARQVAQGLITDVSTGMIDGKPYLLWNQDGCIYALESEDAQPVSLLPEDVRINGGYALVETARNTLLTYAAGGTIRGVFVHDTQRPVTLVQATGTVGRYDVAAVGDQLLFVFTDTEATIGETVETATALRYVPYTFATDITLAATDFDITQAKPGAPLELELTLRNEGLPMVNGVNVTMYDPNGVPIFVDTYSISLPQGVEKTLSVTLTLPAQLLAGDYVLEVLPAEAADQTPENNRSPITLGYSDLAVTARQIVIGDRNYLTIQVENLGNLPSAGQLQVWNQDGSQIGSLELGTLAAGGQSHYLMDVEAFTTGEQPLVTCQITAVGNDSFQLNNRCGLTLYAPDYEDFQQNPEDFEENPTLSAYSAVYDRYVGGNISFEILSGVDQFTGITGFTGWSRSGNTVTLGGNALKALPLGRQVLTLQFGNQTRSFTLDIIDTTPVPLTGVVQVLGQPITGTTVQADLSGIEPANARVVYVWTVDGMVVSQKDNYTIQTQDAGKTLTLMVTGVDGFTGTFQASLIVTLAQPDAPLAPVVMQVNHTSVTLAGADGMEYSLDGASWQTSPIFTGLQVNKTYTFYARYGATADSAASQPSAGVTVTTPKYTAEAPAAPVAEQITDVSVTLAVQPNGLYSMDGLNWQESPVFTGLAANTTYTFYQKLAESHTTLESPVSNGLSVTTLKHTVPKPPMPTVVQRSATTLSLEYVAGYEYSMDGVNWQNPSSGLWYAHSSFMGLSPNTEYTFYQRVAETEDTYASQPSEPLVARTWKHTAGAPSAPTVAEVTSNSITLTAEPGYEYKLLTSYNEYAVVVPISPGIWGTEQEPVTDNEGWQTSPVFEGLQPNRIYYLFRRTAETDTSYASWESKFLKVRTLKEIAPVPAAPEIIQVQWDTVELAYREGYQYRMEGGDWQDSPIFTGLKPNRTYTFYCKMVETDTMLESEISAGTTVTTLKQTQPQPTPPVVVTVTHDSITLEYNDLYIYRLEKGLWQTSPTFTGLEPNRQYAVYRMLRATSEAYESPESDALMVTTLKAPAPVPAAPEIHYIDSFTVILVEQPGYQYRIEGGDWQDSPEFGGLLPNQSYTFYCRTVETDTMLESESSAGITVTTPKRHAAVPEAPQIADIQWDTIILVEQPGYQYRIEGGDWQDSGVFIGLEPNQTYVFYCRTVETDTMLESESSVGTIATTLKQSVNAPAAPTLLEKTFTTITLQSVEGCEYRISGGQWQSSNVFENLQPGVSYVFYQRLKETDTTYASTSSTATLSTQNRYWLDGVLTLEGAPCYGGTLRAVYSDPEATMTYQWYADGVAIEGATGDSYTVRLEDVDKTIMVAITGTGSYVGFVEMATERLIYLSGDVTGDGKVNMKDWNRLYEHINEINPLFEDAQQRSDVTGDGKVNMKDWNRLYEHINEIDPLW